MARIHFCSGLAPEWFKPFDDDPGEFNIRPMTSLLHMEIAQAMAQAMVDNKLNPILPDSFCEKILRECVIGWRNLEGLSEEDRKLAGQGYTFYRLLQLDHDTLRRIVDRILGISVLNQQEKKTS